MITRSKQSQTLRVFQALSRFMFIFGCISVLALCIYRFSLPSLRSTKTRRRLGIQPRTKELLQDVKEAIQTAKGKDWATLATSTRGGSRAVSKRGGPSNYNKFCLLELEHLESYLVEQKNATKELCKKWGACYHPDTRLKELVRRCQVMRLWMEFGFRNIKIGGRKRVFHTFNDAKRTTEKANQRMIRQEYELLLKKYKTIDQFIRDSSECDNDHWRQKCIHKITLFQNGKLPHYLDVSQMATGDCWFAAAAAAVATQRPHFLKEKFKSRNRYDSAINIFDEEIIADETGLDPAIFDVWGRHTTTVKPVQAKWYLLLELAMDWYCQSFWPNLDIVSCETYKTLDAGHLWEGLTAITNYPTKLQTLKDENSNGKMKTGTQFKKVKESYWDNKYPMTCSYIPLGTDGSRNHAYAIVGMTTEKSCCSVLGFGSETHYIHVFDPNNLSQEDYKSVMESNFGDKAEKIPFVSEDGLDATMKVPLDVFKELFGTVCICIFDKTLKKIDIAGEPIRISHSKEQNVFYQLHRPHDRSRTKRKHMQEIQVKEDSTQILPDPKYRTTIWYKPNEFVKEKEEENSKTDTSNSQGNSDTQGTDNAEPGSEPIDSEA